MPDVEAYEASTVDLDRLRSYARRVARETTVPQQPPITYKASHSDQQVEAVGPHWLLHMREHHLEEPFELGAETSHAHYYVVLLPDGSLKTVELVVDEDRRSNRSFTRTRHTYERKHRVEDLSDRAIAWFDFERSFYAHEPTSPEDWKRYWGNLYGERGTLLVGTKGEGILQALEELRIGTPREFATAPDYFDAPDVIPPSTSAVSPPAPAPTTNAVARHRATKPLAAAGTAIVAAFLASLLQRWVEGSNATDKQSFEQFAHDARSAAISAAVICGALAAVVVALTYAARMRSSAPAPSSGQRRVLEHLDERADEAFGAAAIRTCVLTTLWWIVSVVTMQLNDPAVGRYVTSASYAAVLWSIAFVGVALFVIDLTIERGHRAACLVGAAVGFGIFLYQTIHSYERYEGMGPVNLVSCWWVAILAVAGYFSSAVRERSP